MNKQRQIQISINQDAFERLINNKAILLEELHCLNTSSKQLIQQCLLKSLLAKSKRD